MRLKDIFLFKILDIYSQHYGVTPKDLRQKMLLKQYHFMCDCIACQEDWPLYYNQKSFKVSYSN